MIAISIKLISIELNRLKHDVLSMCIYLSLGVFYAIMLIRELIYLFKPYEYWEHTNGARNISISLLCITSILVLLTIMGLKLWNGLKRTLY